MDAGGAGRLGLTLNEKKTSIRNARRESFDFLGYTFGRASLSQGGGGYLGYSPSKKSVARFKQKVGDLLGPRNVAPWAEVRDRLNRMLRGWSALLQLRDAAEGVSGGRLVRV